MRSSSVVQRAAARQVQLVDLSAGSHQRHRALAVPVSCSVVQRRSASATGDDSSCDIREHQYKVKVLAVQMFSTAYLPK